MASMLRDSYSSDKHLEICGRHFRMGNRVPGAAFLSQNISGPIQELQKAKTNTENYELERSHAYDMVLFNDGILDNEVQAAYEICFRIDRESGTAPILGKIFTSGRFGDIKDAPMLQEPLMVKELIERMKQFSSNPLIAQSTERLQSRVNECLAAISEYDRLGKEVALAKTHEEIAQRKLRDQYQLNYLHAVEKLGKRTAELLFPAIARKNSSDELSPEPTSSAS